jgi:hypothetical protein
VCFQFLLCVLASIMGGGTGDPFGQFIQRILEQSPRVVAKSIARETDVGEAMTNVAGAGLVKNFG